MAGGAAKVHQAAFSQQDDPVTTGQCDVIDLGLDVLPLVLLEGDINLVIEVADVATMASSFIFTKCSLRITW